MSDLHEEDATVTVQPDLQLFRRLLGYIWPHKWHAILAVVLSSLSAPLVLAAPPLTKAAVDLFIAPDSSIQPAGLDLLLKMGAESVGLGETRHQGILFIAIVFLAATAGAFLLRYFEIRVIGRMGQRILFDLRDSIFSKAQYLPISVYDRVSTGRLMTRLTADVDSLNELLTSGVVGAIGNLMMIFYVVAWMLWVNWRLAAVSLAILPLLILLAIWFRLGARPRFGAVRAGIANINSFLSERLTGVQIIQLFNREEEEAERFDQINDRYLQANFGTVVYTAGFHPLVEIIQAVGVALIILFGGGQAIRGVVSIGTVIAFVQLTRAFYEPISEISEKYNALQAALASAERIFRLLDSSAPAVAARSEVKRIDAARGRIEFRNVWFAYDEGEWVLKNVSFIIEAGDRVAFVGHTGAGKTTITNLLLRFYEVQRGQILLDDIDIGDIDLQELRSSFSIVLQDVFLFSTDMTSNIRLGNEGITDEMVESAAREVHADAFISRLQHGYRTELHERGSQLSGGQRQLIGFSRALAFNRPVLILDEATSSVDPETEMLIHNAIERLMAGRTSLIIAHRLSTIRSVDRIIVMHKGEICEEGDHDSLIALRGIYWRLCQLQFERRLKRSAADIGACD